MLFGTTGRTDLLGSDHTQELTHAQYHSVRRLADELPADTKVYPPTDSAASVPPPRPAASRRPSANNATPTPP